MAEGTDRIDRQLSREDFLKLAAAAGGAGLVASRTGVAGAAWDRLTAESGKLQVLDWIGYEVPELYAPYLKKYPARSRSSRS